MVALVNVTKITHFSFHLDLTRFLYDSTLRKTMICLTKKRLSGILTRSSAGCVTLNSNRMDQNLPSTWYMRGRWRSCLAGNWYWKITIISMVNEVRADYSHLGTLGETWVSFRVCAPTGQIFSQNICAADVFNTTYII